MYFLSEKVCSFILWFYHIQNLEFFLMLKKVGTSLVAQWLRICLPIQGSRVRALVQGDPTCPGATKPVRHNY